ncbi:MlaD family protein [Paraconexibacter sp.]|uniref:MlaD family protein n=1 Tax=Paraconexibacter sp. TaxID=2949640 RepID=UPI00356ABB64
MSRALVRSGVLAALALFAVVLLVILTGGEGRRVSFVVPAATNLLTGNAVESPGGKIGVVADIEPVDRGRAARVTMRIDDDKVWPLRRDARLEIRQGGTVSFSNRYVLVRQGTSSAPEIRDGGELPPSNVTVPVEVDTVISKLDPPVQRDLARLIKSGAEFADLAGPDLRNALRVAPRPLESAAGLLSDLARNQDQLTRLVVSTGSVVDAVDRSSPDVRVVLDGLAGTLETVASRQERLRETLGRLPAALRQTRATLDTADVTLREAADLTDRLAPGVTQLQRIAAPLTRVLTSLRTITPAARRTLDAVGKTRAVSSALNRVADVTPRIGSIGAQATEELKCIRPYAPELVAFGASWGDWMSPVDSRDHVVRAQVQNYLPANYNSNPNTPEDIVKTFPGVEYGFPRPPGTIAGQPWFLPECGAGPDALDPSKDKEGANPPERRETLPKLGSLPARTGGSK